MKEQRIGIKLAKGDMQGTGADETSELIQKGQLTRQKEKKRVRRGAPERIKTSQKIANDLSHLGVREHHTPKG